MKEKGFPLIGIIVNIKGQKEENYLYRPEEIEKIDSVFVKEVLVDGISESGSSSNKTWIGFLLRNKDEVKKFLTGTNNDSSTDEDWYWQDVIKNDLYGNPSETMKTMIRLLGLKRNQLIGY